ncbi:MAG TPA: glutamine amidotransferase [Vicinamibacterales bacterium]|nr:glutamine amidotransferase [Vicinamibacterales bacterium]
MLDALFRFFFGLSPVVFSQGEFRFAASTGSYVAAAAIAVAAALAVVAYRGSRGRARTRDRVVLATIRLAFLVVLLICMFRPLLVVKAAVPQQNFLGVLLDDSRSMQIADVDGQPRGSYVKSQFGTAESGVLKALSDRFTVRTFRFSSAPERTLPGSELTFGGSQSRLGAALSGVRQELAGLPVAGLVMVSDGADTADAALGDAILGLKAEGLPVFTIGVGRETLPRDIQVGRVATPKTALKGTTLMVDVVLSQTGYDGQQVTLDVEDDGTLVSTQQVTLPDAGAPASIPVRFTVTEAGPRVLRFRVSPQEGELVTENNARDALIDVRDRKEKVLYFEGEPRWEYKYIRRAIPETDNLVVTSLIRTADNKYMRQGVDHADELVAAFPKTREELFAYRSIILGSLEAAALTGDQLKMIAEFVDRRGGGLLMLGGPRSFAEGGYAGTAVADVLPVVLDRNSVMPKGTVLRLTVKPTRAGAATAVTQLGTDEAKSAERWSTLPPVTAVNRVDAVKPGATVLLTGTDASRAERPMLIFQRYGRGKSFAFLPQDSWLWQMHSSIPVEDLTHENYWRQLLRWLVDGVPDQVEPSLANERVEPGETAELMAAVVDPSFVELNDAAVMATVTAPDGTISDVPMSWDGEEAGLYNASIPTKAPGWYEVKIQATREGKPVGNAVTHFRAAPGDAEYFDATMHAATLRRIAEETGGRFYEANDVESLADDLRYTGRGVTTVEEHDLWHMPIVLMLLIGLLCAEWGYRRVVGLA